MRTAEHLVAVAVAVAALAPATARADTLGLLPGYDDPQPSFAWQGAFQQRSLYFTSTRTHTSLYATVYAPADPGTQTYPAVVILPGSQIGVQAQYGWAARDLAGHGYIALTVDEQGAGRSGIDADHPCGPGPPAPQCANQNSADQSAYIDALESGIDFLLSPRNPFYANVDPDEVGAAGHSAGADLISWYQAIDRRIKAIVAWDNLISSPTGDQGNAQCNRKPTTLVVPRVPALGEASETCVGRSQPLPPDAKKTGYERWRSQHEPTMEVVFAGVQHLEFAQEDNIDAGAGGGSASGSETQLHDFAYYTRAWFDLWLRNDETAVARLLSPTVNGRPRAQVLSSRYTSAIYLPQRRIDCENLLGCPTRPPAAPAAPPVAACASHRVVVVHLRRRFRARLRGAYLRLAGGRVQRFRSVRSGVRVDLRGRPAGRVVVKIVMHLRGGRTVTDVRAYHPCRSGHRAVG